MDTAYRRTPVLPVEAYTTQEWFEREQRDLFSNVWHFVGMESDVPSPGDHITAQIGLHPLFVVRGDDHRLRAFHNICRHRGTMLLRATGQSSTGIVCPYHNWTYSINGRLISVPQREVFTHVELDDVALHGASVETWMGMVFAHPEPDPPTTLMGWLAGFPEHVGPHRPDRLLEVEPSDHVWRANWKIVVENYIDGYHLFHLHADTLDMYDHAEAESGFHGRHFAFYEPPVPAMREWLGRNRGYILDDIGEDDWGAFVHMLFPGTGLIGLEMSYSIFQVIPLGPESTRVHIRNFTNERNRSAAKWTSAWTAVGSWFAGGRGDDPLASGDFMEEDRYACEQQQLAMHSPKFGVGATSLGFEDGVVGFQQHVAEYLGTEP